MSELTESVNPFPAKGLLLLLQLHQRVQAHTEIPPTRNVNFCQLCFSGTCIKSEKWSRMSHDMQEAERKYFIQTVMSCYEGRERVNSSQ